MKIYTKTGDNGETSLFSGERVPKYNNRVDLYGTIDELQAILALAIEYETESDNIISCHNTYPIKRCDNPISQDINIILEKLFILSSDFATKYDGKNTSIKRISNNDILFLENLIDSYAEKLSKLSNFILPKGKFFAFINLARTICRRAERIAYKVASIEDINKNGLLFLNRLSDYLFIVMCKDE